MEREKGQYIFPFINPSVQLIQHYMCTVNKEPWIWGKQLVY